MVRILYFDIFIVYVFKKLCLRYLYLLIICKRDNSFIKFIFVIDMGVVIVVILVVLILLIFNIVRSIFSVFWKIE